ncbi:hypothetical protein [Streptomyces sp. NBC_01294]|uniref:hypothetical protein n=1 Tax=Streptomyces sp. NBC_01294 TaxID=2903815 RepID=UPI002DDABB13|nr:hypothetical protein [Streptomyces sp. NBC_01294]WRZ55258.1 hypothetical protein OG534_01430 [Streptomyces sp. NBC_01294]WRZ61438.1 hypothetical protein OG534_36070 [Streptomyces sp. NBC_01294]
MPVHCYGQRLVAARSREACHIPACLARNTCALHAYLAENEKVWLDELDRDGGCVSVNERSLDEAY